MSRWYTAFCQAIRVGLFAVWLVVSGTGFAVAQRPAAHENFPETGPEVDVALVLAVDISFSMDLTELNLQREGYIEALTSPLVLETIRKGMIGKIAVTYVEWAGVHTRHIIADWEIIEDKASAEAFVQKLRDAPIRRARRTSISTAIDLGIDQLKAAPVRPIRRVIDISGDGPNNEGRIVTLARDHAVEAGVVINGLPIVLQRGGFRSPYDVDGLDDYYRDCVIGGPGSFMIVINERDQFAPAIKQKILREIAQSSQNDVTAPARGNSDCRAGEQQWQRNWERN
ncbi:vWFA domain containing protein [Rhabdaerophilaceae bacterium]